MKHRKKKTTNTIHIGKNLNNMNFQNARDLCKYK